MEIILIIEKLVFFIFVIPTFLGLFIIIPWIKYYGEGETFPKKYQQYILFALLGISILIGLIIQSYINKRGKAFFNSEFQNLQKNNAELYLNEFILLDSSKTIIKSMKNLSNISQFTNKYGGRFLTKERPLNIKLKNNKKHLDIIIEKHFEDSTIHMVSFMFNEKEIQIGILKTSLLDDYFYFDRYIQKQYDKEKELEKIYPYKIPNEVLKKI